MARSNSDRRVAAVAVAVAAVTFAGIGSARGSVLSSSPSLPLLGDPYSFPGGGCFVVVGLCSGNGELTLNQLAGPGFRQTATDELITTTATLVAPLYTFPSLTADGTLTLTGIVTQDVLGRTSPLDDGSWTVDLTALSLTGSLGGYALAMSLDSSSVSSGTSSVTQAGHGFIINSFFDIFTELTLDTPTPLSTSRSGVGTASAPVPEPATVTLLGGAVLAMAGLRRLFR